MEVFEEIGQQIFRFVNDPEGRAVRGLIGIPGARFIVCGISGSGKTRAIGFANSLLSSMIKLQNLRSFSGKITHQRHLIFSMMLV